ncbi:hypothetical protein [uncultured Streptomyces sp.]|uniref:hypothetical protein n=1 Tax=uncultured Streptomyces sp. TaxID=174707 RepID=UPI0026138379|nr:hypothetical protein [uncultured Streptomyces sp.]
MQLDGVGRKLSELAVQPGTAEGQDGPVFVDESGRRGKTLRKVGWLIALACAAFAVTLVMSVFGGSSAAPWLPLTGQDQKGSAPGLTDGEPAVADPTGSASAPPAPSASAADGGTAGVADPEVGEAPLSASVSPAPSGNPAESAAAPAEAPAAGGASRSASVPAVSFPPSALPSPSLSPDAPESASGSPGSVPPTGQERESAL